MVRVHVRPPPPPVCFFLRLEDAAQFFDNRMDRENSFLPRAGAIPPELIVKERQ